MTAKPSDAKLDKSEALLRVASFKLCAFQSVDHLSVDCLNGIVRPFET
jgi:hypothetical protein